MPAAAHPAFCPDRYARAVSWTQGVRGVGRAPPGDSLLRLCQGVKLRFLDVEVREDVLDVLVVFELFHEPEHLIRLFAGQLHVRLGDHGDFRGSGRDVGGLQAVNHLVQLGRG